MPTVELAPTHIGTFERIYTIAESYDTNQIGFLVSKSQAEQKIVIIDTETWETTSIPNNPARHDKPIGFFQFLSGGDSIAIQIGEDVLVLDRDQWKEDWTERTRIGGVSRITSIAGNRLVGAELKVWNLDDPESPPTELKYSQDAVQFDDSAGYIKNYEVAHGSAISHDGKLIALPGYSTGAVNLMNTTNGREVSRLVKDGKDLGYNVMRLGFAPRGDRLIAMMNRRLGDAFREVYLWNTKTGQRVAKLAVGGFNRHLNQIGFSSDGSVVFVTRNNSRFELFDAETGTPFDHHLPAGRRSRHVSLALSPGAHAICLRRYDEGFVLYGKNALVPYAFLNRKRGRSPDDYHPVYFKNGVVVILTQGEVMIFGSRENLPTGTIPELQF